MISKKGIFDFNHNYWYASLIAKTLYVVECFVIFTKFKVGLEKIYQQKITKKIIMVYDKNIIGAAPALTWSLVQSTD